MRVWTEEEGREGGREGHKQSCMYREKDEATERDRRSKTQAKRPHKNKISLVHTREQLDVLWQTNL